MKALNQLTQSDFTETTQPFALFDEWFAQARDKEINDPSAMALATVDSDGLPNVRMVLMKEHDERGFVFYTNRQSAKGCELDVSWRAAINFHWKSLRRQVRVRGIVNGLAFSDDGRTLVAAVGSEHRLGRWWKYADADEGLVVIPIAAAAAPARRR